MRFTIDLQEEDGRWLAWVVEARALPGVMTYGRTRQEAICAAEALALRELAKQIEHGAVIPSSPLHVLFSVAGTGATARAG